MSIKPLEPYIRIYTLDVIEGKDKPMGRLQKVLGNTRFKDKFRDSV